MNPGTIDNDGSISIFMTALANANHSIYNAWQYKTTKRSQPTITLYSDGTGTSGKVVMAAGDVNGTADEIGFSHCRVSGTNGAASTNRLLSFHATADAEL